MIDEKKLDALARIVALDIFKGNSYRSLEERKLARDIWMNGIVVGEEKTKDNDFEEPEADDIERE